MKLTYDPRHNIAYLRFHRRTRKVETIRLSDEVNIDVAPDGTVYGIELLNANEQLRGEDRGNQPGSCERRERRANRNPAARRPEMTLLRRAQRRDRMRRGTGAIVTILLLFATAWFSQGCCTSPQSIDHLWVKPGLTRSGQRALETLLNSTSDQEFATHLHMIKSMHNEQTVLVLVHAMFALPMENDWWRNVKDEAGFYEAFLMKTGKPRVAWELYTLVRSAEFTQLVSHYFRALYDNAPADKAEASLLNWVLRNSKRFKWDGQTARFCEISRPFDDKAWRLGDAEERGTMVSDLVEKGVLKGRSREEVKKILGPPDIEGERNLLYKVDQGGALFGIPPLLDEYVEVECDSATSKVISVDFADD